MALVSSPNLLPNMDTPHTIINICNPFDLNDDKYEAKYIKHTTLNIFLRKTEQLSIFLKFQIKMNINIWKSSGLKIRILHCLLIFLYFVVSIDFIRLPWFILAKYSTEDTGPLLAKCFFLYLKIYPNMLAINILWNRQYFIRLLGEFASYIPVNQCEKHIAKYNKMGIFQIAFNIWLIVALCFIIHILLPIVLQEPEYFLGVMGFPLTRKSRLFEFILMINFLTQVLANLITLPNNVMILVLLPYITDEFKCLSDELENMMEKMHQGNRGIFVTRNHCSKTIYEIINQHGRLCHLLKFVNAISKGGGGISIFTFILICCTIAYEIANQLVTGNGYILQIVTGILTALACLVVIFKGLQINFCVSTHVLILTFPVTLNATSNPI